MDHIFDKLPFFTPEHRSLAQDVVKFVNLEIEPHAIEERDVEERAKNYVSVMAKAGVLDYSVARESKLDIRDAKLLSILLCLLNHCWGHVYTYHLTSLTDLLTGYKHVKTSTTS